LTQSKMFAKWQLKSPWIALSYCVLLPVIWSTEAPPLRTLLKASWNAPSILLEIVETVSRENSSAYLPLINEIIRSDIHDFGPRTEHAKIYYDVFDIITSKQFLSDPSAKSVFELSLSLSTAAPTIQAYYQYYETAVLPALADNDTFNPNCKVWADWYGKQACTVSELKRIVDEEGSEFSSTLKRYFMISLPDQNTPKLLSFDHVFQPTSSSQSKPIIILYTEDLSQEFSLLHSYISTLVERDFASYVLRYKPPSVQKREDLYLSGYGVELVLKNTDYIVIDDRDLGAEEQSEAIADQENASNAKQEDHRSTLSEHLFDETISEIKPLKIEEIKHLGTKSTQFITGSKNPLLALTRLSQDFPKYSHSIAQLTLNVSMVEELTNVHSTVQPGTNAIWLNGMPISENSFEPFQILKLLKRERHTILSFTRLGLTAVQAISLVSSPMLWTKSADDVSNNIYNIFDTSENGNVLMWFNDLEKDPRYSSWPAAVYSLLRPVYPGTLRQIRKNLFSILYVVDLASVEGLTLVEEENMFIMRGIPLRFGLVPLVGDKQSDSALIASAVYYLKNNYDFPTVFDFISKVLKVIQETPSKSILETAQAEFETIVTKRNPNNGRIITKLDELLKEDPTVAEEIDGAIAYAKRFAIIPGSSGALFVNGKYHDFDESYQRNIMLSIGEQTNFLQQKVHSGEFDDNSDALTLFTTLPNVLPRRNMYISVSESHPLKVLNLADRRNDVATKYQHLKYLYTDKLGTNGHWTTVWVFADFDSETGVQQALESLKFLESAEDVRLSFIHNPVSAADKHDVSSIIYQLHHDTFDSPSKAFEFVKKGLEKAARISEGKAGASVLGQQEDILLDENIETVHAEKAKAWRAEDKKAMDDFWRSWQKTIKEDCRVDGGESFIIVGPFAAKEIFLADEFHLLLNIETAERVVPVINTVNSLELKTELDGEEYAEFLAKLTSIVSASTVSDVPVGIMDEDEISRKHAVGQVESGLSRFHTGDIETAIYQFEVLLDPLSEIAQKWSAILEVLSHIEGVFIEVRLNPLLALEELPLKRFYRYVLPSRPVFDSDSGTLMPPMATFNSLPTEPLFTLSVDTIQPWLVTPTECIYDLDNLRLSALDSRSRRKPIEAIFELENILVEGHARDTSGMTPRGLQLILGTKTQPAMEDTIVMANLGYFQLKANPGVWELGLREGRSKEIYEIESVGSEGWYSRRVDKTGVDIVITNFEGTLIYPRVKRKPGMEREDVLEGSENKEEGIWNFVKNKFSNKDKITKDNAEINIFSVASGHLYERFLSIMIIGVLRHTKSTVKFWFIENFLSPSFKVRWRKNTNSNTNSSLTNGHIGFASKKRNNGRYGGKYYQLGVVFWCDKFYGATNRKYKILFLDVLFPLDLGKVIFVDADQIVRTDLKELIDMDLKGAPYGYTPFCDNRPEMDGFRFWKGGYWKDHLRGKPYHISALYVIDLHRFRQIAAGDRLRGQYQMLSSDPNSLANLDQDLPNNMQHDVPIFSLPQEWLWCETWCSDESLATAKTIDLCNNPLTKEPKLDRARRQVPEWESYDNEVAAFASRIAKEKKSLACSTGIGPCDEDDKIVSTSTSSEKTGQQEPSSVSSTVLPKPEGHDEL
ncbi:6133_t:CDS:10, partial [Paraglomus occultum]